MKEAEDATSDQCCEGYNRLRHQVSKNGQPCVPCSRKNRVIALARPPKTQQNTPGTARRPDAVKKPTAAEERNSNLVEEPNQPTSTSTGNGGEELAMAQRYLSGANGGRNSAEAAQWLWKSISKHNAEATLVLADLYLRGDGVSKNCDQASVLLDMAARKNIAGAGERLRNLQAFGCQ